VVATTRRHNGCRRRRCAAHIRRSCGDLRRGSPSACAEASFAACALVLDRVDAIGGRVKIGGEE
jgi:hypothetical protein